MKKNITYFALLLLLSGCATSHKQWRPREDINAPFVSEDLPAKAWVREVSPPLFVVTAPWYEYAWEIKDIKTNEMDIGNSISRYLERVGYTQNQKLTSAWWGDMQYRKAEHSFFIVSLNPIIVIMKQPRFDGHSV